MATTFYFVVKDVTIYGRLKRMPNNFDVFVSIVWFYKGPVDSV